MNNNPIEERPQASSQQTPNLRIRREFRTMYKTHFACALQNQPDAKTQQKLLQAAVAKAEQPADKAGNFAVALIGMLLACNSEAISATMRILYAKHAPQVVINCICRHSPWKLVEADAKSCFSQFSENSRIADAVSGVFRNIFLQIYDKVLAVELREKKHGPTPALESTAAQKTDLIIQTVLQEVKGSTGIKELNECAGDSVKTFILNRLLADISM